MPLLPEAEPLQALINSLKRLPSVGVRTARRMAYHLLQHDRQGAVKLSEALQNAINKLKHCTKCNGFTERDICETCTNPKRDAGLLCVVETPADQNTIESSHGYKGLYYVLMGRLAPLEGVGPSELHFDQLIKRATDGTVSEVIVATSFTAEGETTAHYLLEVLGKHGLKTTRLARGVPAGGELEYVDASTIAWALIERR